MESEDSLIQKLRGLLPKTNPFIVTDLAHQLVSSNILPEDILGTNIDDRFYTRERGNFIPTDLSLYSSDASASIFISKEMSHGVGLGYYQAHSQVISKVLDQVSKYHPIYRRVDIDVSVRDSEGKTDKKTLYCLMGAAMRKP